MSKPIRKHDDVLIVRLSRATKRRAKKRARELNVGVSELVRLLILYGDAVEITRGEGA